jgi:uncharacterized protein YjeT (DUF2065 family)
MLYQLAIAFALILVIEGALYALFPNGMKRMLLSMIDVPASALRTAGLTSAIAGVVLVWFLRG